jgi:hypothetical protein
MPLAEPARLVSREVTLQREGSPGAVGQVDTSNQDAGKSGNPSLDLDRTTEQVYERILRKLRVERERSRGLI